MRYFAFLRLTSAAYGLLLAAAGLAFWPSASSASCGDWLSERGHPTRNNRLAGVFGESDDYRVVTNPTPPAQPCNGPHCDRKSGDFPHVPTTPSFKTPPNQPAWLTAADTPHTEGRDRSGRDECVERGRYVPFRLDRPPRD